MCGESPSKGSPDEAANGKKLKQVWSQGLIPVVLRRNGRGERVRFRMPVGDSDALRFWSDKRTEPDWNSRLMCWEIPKAWFNDFVNRALRRFGKVYIIQPYREQEICAPACQNARGHECQCSCMGQHHGAGSDGSWFEVSETFATRWGNRHLACRLLVRKRAESERSTSKHPNPP